jgi:hypothetical protein
MRRAGSGIAAVLGFVTVFAAAPVRGETAYDERSAGMRALYTTGAVVANIVPITSAFVAPKCLPGYVLCKVSFAGASVVFATAQLLLSGGSDLEQTKAILTRGFSGDWYLTGRHVAGDVKPQPYPEVAPPATASSGSVTPPPL